MSGKVIILSAPSGSGKTMLVKYLLEKNTDLSFSISASTRHTRNHLEKEGKDYYFLTAEVFQRKITNNEFVEWEEVYSGQFYGTLRSEIDRIWDAKKNIIFDVDVKGGIQLKKYFNNKALSVFVKVPSMEILKSRLVSRNTETQKNLHQRLSKAELEMTFVSEFDEVLINDNIEESKKKVMELYANFKKKF